MKVKCPYCHKQTEYSPENKFRPFCSERCQLIDLGQWAEGKYAIPAASDTNVADEEGSETESSEERQFRVDQTE